MMSWTRITVIRADGTTEDIIADGKFVLAGTETLNKPFIRNTDKCNNKY